MTETIISASEFKQALKKIGLKTVTSELNRHKAVAHRGYIGIRGGSVGPMTATSAWQEHNRQAEEKVTRLLRELGIPYQYSDGIITVTLNTGKKPAVYKFLWNTFRTYAHNDYDTSYLTYWLILNKI